MSHQSFARFFFSRAGHLTPTYKLFISPLWPALADCRIARQTRALKLERAVFANPDWSRLDRHELRYEKQTRYVHLSRQKLQCPKKHRSLQTPTHKYPNSLFAMFLCVITR
jgi:hypothetical protein